MIIIQVLTKEFEHEIRQITKLSSEVNGEDAEKILDMIQDHAGEITELYKQGNDHYKVETADLIVLCFELIKTKNGDVEHVFNKFLPRFYKKLNKLKTQKNK